MSILDLRLHAAGAARRAVHRAGGAGRRHLPRAAAAGAHGRRHRPRRRHRRRARAAHRDLPDLDRRRRRDPRRRADRGDPRARPHQRRRRAGAALLRRHRRRRAADRARRPERRRAPAVPLRRPSPPSRSTTCWSPWSLRCRRRARRCVGLSPQLFAVAQDQEFARVAGLHVRAYNLLVAVLAAVTVTVAMRTVGLLLVSRADGGAGGHRAAAHPLLPHHARRRDGARHRSRRSAGCRCPRSAPSRPRSPRARRSCCSPWPASLATWPVGVWLRRRHRLRAPFAGVDQPARPRRRPTSTRTTTARTAATSPSAHGDHVDYVHDGHRHAVARRSL